MDNIQIASNVTNIHSIHTVCVFVCDRLNAARMIGANVCVCVCMCASNGKMVGKNARVFFPRMYVKGRSVYIMA